MRPAALLASVDRVLCIGAHPDDIEIGCGATLRALERANPAADTRWLVLTSTEMRRAEAGDSAKRYLGDEAPLTIHSFRDGHLPYDDPGAVKAAVLEHRGSFTPDVVLSPRRGDAHQDHRFAGELAWQVYRDQAILEYEIAKYDGDMGSPNVYVPVAQDDCDRKIADLFAAFPSQVGQPWFHEGAFRGLMRLRGIECAAPSGYAEAFYVGKLTLA